MMIASRLNKSDRGKHWRDADDFSDRETGASAIMRGLMPGTLLATNRNWHRNKNTLKRDAIKLYWRWGKYCSW